jgi:hypothetical protein
MIASTEATSGYHRRYRKITFKKSVRELDKGPQWAGFGLWSVLCPPLGTILKNM